MQQMDAPNGLDQVGLFRGLKRRVQTYFMHNTGVTRVTGKLKVSRTKSNTRHSQLQRILAKGG